MESKMVEEEKVILVDEKDIPIGSMEKMEAHRQGLLHRAFSVFLFDDKNQLLLQQRAAGKYHSGGLWTNACCSHPRPEEPMENAIQRKLEQELGISCQVEKKFTHTYKARFENGLTEHETDHIYFGRFNGEIHPNPEEVLDYRFISFSALEEEMKRYPENFTAWFKILWPLVVAELET